MKNTNRINNPTKKTIPFLVFFLVFSSVNSQNSLVFGDKAPSLNGINYSNGMKKMTVGFEGSITLLTFFNLVNPSCTAAMKCMQETGNRFGDTLEAMGVCLVALTSNRTKKLKEFLAINRIRCTILLANEETIAGFKVKSWPVIYLVDSSGHISLVRESYETGTCRDLRRVISSYLDY